MAVNKSNYYHQASNESKLKEKKVSNKLKTAGYTIKRLKDNGFVVFKMFNAYSNTDPRRWTVLINPGDASIYLTCYHNKDNINEIMLMQIPGISNTIARQLLEQYISIYNLIDCIKKNENCLNNFQIQGKNIERKLSKNVISNIKDFLIN